MRAITKEWVEKAEDDFYRLLVFGRACQLVPSAKLAHFLESGPPQVHLGFGNMRDKDLERRTRLALYSPIISFKPSINCVNISSGICPTFSPSRSVDSVRI